MILWGFSNIVDKYILEFTPISFYAGVKYTVAGIVFLALFRLKKKDIFGSHLKGIILNSILIVIHLSLFFIGITMVTGFTVTMIFALTPILLFVSSIGVLHEKFRLRVLSGLVVAVSGIFLMIIATSGNSEEGNTLLGATLAFSAVIFGTASSLLAKKMLKEKVTSDVMASTTLVVSGVFFSLIAIWQGLSSTIDPITSRSWMYAMLSGLVFTLVPWGLYYRALKRIELEEVSVFVYLGPVAGGIGSIVILGEQVTLAIAVGSVLVIVGLWLSQHKARSFKPHFNVLHHIYLKKTGSLK